MIRHKLFTIDRKTNSVISHARKHCLIRTLSADGKENDIHGVDPVIQLADGVCMVSYTERYSTRFKKENRGKRMLVPVSEIIEDQTWDHFRSLPSRPPRKSDPL